MIQIQQREIALKEQNYTLNSRWDTLFALQLPLPPSPLYIRPPLLFLLHCMLLSLMYLLKRISEKSLIVTKLIKLDLVLIVLLTIVFGAAKCVCAEARECNRGNSLIKVALFKQR